jgi:hypothetical protein
LGDEVEYIYWGGSIQNFFLLSSRIDFNTNTKITINNQQSPEIKNRAIFGFTEVAGDGEVL